jgi:hypothetical protein
VHFLHGFGTWLFLALGHPNAPDTSGWSHDFDFNFGVWKTHIRRLEHPLTGSSSWVEYAGTHTVRKMWNGRANIGELEVDGPGGHLEGMQVRLYDPHAHQWGLYFASSADGTLGTPEIGEFKHGRAEFYEQERYNGRMVLVRTVLSGISPTTVHQEQAYSVDGGKSWEVNWVMSDTLISRTDTLASPVAARAVDSHDFDFDFGNWNTHITRRLHPLSGSDETMQLTGTVTIHKIWGGRAQWEEIEADGPKGHWEGMTVFLYNPKARQWSMNFVESSDGEFTTPMIGSFENGRGELISPDTFKGRSILVRGVWSDFTPTSHTYQESFSTDDGRTWQLVFTALKTKR